MVRQGRSIALVVAFVIGCAVLVLMVGCAGTSSETSNKKEEGGSPQAIASEEEARCEGTRTFHVWYVVYPNGQNSSPQSGSAEDMKKAGKKAGKVEEAGIYTTNDLPGCPKGGLLSGTDKPDLLDAKEGDDEIRGLGAKDVIKGGPGSDILYGGAGDDRLDAGYGQGQGQDVIFGGDGNDLLDDLDDQRGKLYCGEGKDRYVAEKIDYVDNSCEKTAVGQGA